jgi:hypothetical protein
MPGIAPGQHATNERDWLEVDQRAPPEPALIGESP